MEAHVVRSRYEHRHMLQGWDRHELQIREQKSGDASQHSPYAQTEAVGFVCPRLQTEEGGSESCI